MLISDVHGRGSGGLVGTGQRQVQPAPAGGVGDGVAQGGGHRPLNDFSGTEEGFSRLVEQMHIDFIRQLRETQNRITAPVVAANASRVVGDFFVQGPARGLDDAALDLIAQAIGADDLAEDRKSVV